MRNSLIEPSTLRLGLSELEGIMADVEPGFRDAFLDELEEMVCVAEAMLADGSPKALLRANAIIMIVGSAIAKTALDIQGLETNLLVRMVGKS